MDAEPETTLRVLPKGSEVANRASYPIALTGRVRESTITVSRLWQLPRATARVSSGAGTGFAG